MVVMAILLATSLTTFAIGFEAEEIYESVFVVYSGNSLGSGFAIGKDCIITNAHVIDNPNKVIIKTYSGNEYSAFVIGLNQEQDIAILGVKGIEFPYLKIADSSLLKTGADIYAIGAPKSMAYTLTKGIISALNREIRGNKYIQIDAAINEGNSGGPLLNDSGEVLGMNTLKMSNSEGIGLAIPMETVISFLTNLNLDIDESGNITGDIKTPETNENKPDDTKPNDTKPNDNVEKDNHDETSTHSPLFYIICIIAVLSIIGNIALGVALVYQKKSNLNLKYDPRERTDFDIDILG
jgi:serine protease Do